MLTITQRYSIERLSWIPGTIFTSALTSALVRDPTLPPDTVPTLWPQWGYMLPDTRGVVPAVMEKAANGMRFDFARALPLSDRHLLGSRLEKLLLSWEPPTAKVDWLDLFDFLTEGSENLKQLGEMLGDFLATVDTAHEMRDYAILCLHMLGLRTADFAATMAEKAR